MKQKIKIMNYKEELSEKEIQSYMDFNRVLENRKVALLASRKKIILKWGALVLLATLVTIGFFKFNVDRPVPTESSEKGPVASSQEVAPAVTPLDSAEPAKKEINHAEPIKKQNSQPPAVTVIPKTGKDNSDQPIVSEKGYVQAEPLNGYPQLYDYFNASLVYPASALKDSIQGVQTVSFIISKEGSVEQIEVEQSLGAEFEKESIRLIQNMPGWKPARLDGKPVATRISLPITFQIQKIK